LGKPVVVIADDVGCIEVLEPVREGADDGVLADPLVGFFRVLFREIHLFTKGHLSPKIIGIAELVDFEFLGLVFMELFKHAQERCEERLAIWQAAVSGETVVFRIPLERGRTQPVEVGDKDAQGLILDLQLWIGEFADQKDPAREDLPQPLEETIVVGHKSPP